MELQKQVATLVATQPAPAAAPEDSRAWITGKGVKTLRRKTGLSQRAFGLLTGVSTGAVTLWESKSGILKLRDDTKKAVMSVRGIGKAEARKRLAELAPAKGKKAKVAKGKVSVKKAGLKRRKYIADPAKGMGCPASADDVIIEVKSNDSLCMQLPKKEGHFIPTGS